MTLPQNPPFYADQLGSYKRPDYLIEKRHEFEDGKISEQQLDEVADKAIENIIKVQREAGIQSITDGEFRRHMFFDGVHSAMEGFRHLVPCPPELLKDYVPDVAAFKALNFHGGDTYICNGKIKRITPWYVDQFTRLAKMVKPEEVPHLKITMAAPEWYHLRHGEHAYPKDVYKTDAEYLADISTAYRAELKDLYAAGCRSIQIDDPLLAYFCAESMIKGMEAEGVDHEKLLGDYIQCYNDCFKDKPKDLIAAVHLCRGNFKDGRHFSEGGYDRIAARLFNDLNADVYMLEWETARAGTFEPIKFLPPNKRCILGIISSKVPQLEDIEELKKKVYSCADILSKQGNPPRSREEALAQLGVSPQCGFASHSEGNPVTEQDVINKLKLVRETADAIWPGKA